MEKVKRKSPLRTAFKKLTQNKLATICFFILLIEIILVVFAPVFTITATKSRILQSSSVPASGQVQTTPTRKSSMFPVIGLELITSVVTYGPDFSTAEEFLFW